VTNKKQHSHSHTLHTTVCIELVRELLHISTSHLIKMAAAPMFAFLNNLHESNGQIDSSTPFIAASDGDLNLLQQSLAHLSAPATIADTNGLTPLHAAASYNHLDIVRWLFTQNVDVNATDSDGDTPLHHCENASAAKVLVEEGRADYTIKNSEGQTALEVKEEELQDMGIGIDLGEHEGVKVSVAMDEQEGAAMDEQEGDDEEKAALDELVGYLKTLP